MNRRSLLHSLVVWFGAVVAVGLSARPAQAYYYFFQYRYTYSVHRSRRRSRWQVRSYR